MIRLLSIFILITINATLAHATELIYCEVNNKNSTFYSGFDVLDTYSSIIRPLRKDTAFFRQQQQHFLNLLVQDFQLDEKEYHIEIIVDACMLGFNYGNAGYYRAAPLICFKGDLFEKYGDSTLQIYYDHTIYDTYYHYDEIYALVKYAAENFDFIYANQKTMRFIRKEEDRYSKDDSLFFLTSIDTFITKSIPIKHINFYGWPNTGTNNKHWIPIGILLLASSIVIPLSFRNKNATPA